MSHASQFTSILTFSSLMSSAFRLAGFSIATSVRICMRWFCMTSLQSGNDQPQTDEVCVHSRLVVLRDAVFQKTRSPNDSGLVKVSGPALRSEILLERDEHRPDVVPVPRGIKHPIAESAMDHHYRRMSAFLHSFYMFCIIIFPMIVFTIFLVCE